jgi:hypothetical protein
MIFDTIATDTREALESAFPFTVDKFPVSFPDNIKASFFGLLRSDGVPVGKSSVGAGYHPHTLEDVAALVESSKAAFADVEGDTRFEFECLWNDGHIVNLQPGREFRREVAANDLVYPKLSIRAGYDGGCFEATLGMFREACTNLMFPKMVSGTKIKIKHTKSMPERLEELNAKFQRMRAGWDGIVAEAEEMEQREVRVSEILVAVYGEVTQGASNTVAKNHADRTKEICERMFEERDRLGRRDMGKDIATGWELFNAIQGWEQHDRRRNSNPSDFERAILAANEDSVRDAERLILAS